MTSMHTIQLNIPNYIYPKPLSIYIIMLLLPFLVFYRIIPFTGTWTLANDWPRFLIPQQMEFMFSLKTGSFPLYIPGFAGGQSSSALTLGQIFHPISHICAHMPGYWTGKALEWNIFFRLLTLGFTQLLLFEFLRRLKFNNLISFLLSFVTVYNLQMAFQFFYGASFESWTGYLLLCTAIGLYYLNPKTWHGPLFIIGSTYWLVCSGHPQMMYYGLLGAGFFTIITPYFVVIILPDKNIGIYSVLNFWIKAFLLCAVGIILSSAYTVPYYFDFITNSVRVGQSYAWANDYLDTFMGTMNNFFQPLRSYSGFGGSSLFLISALIPLLLFFRVRVPYVIMVIWILVLVLFLHIQGERTPVHYLVWKYLPFASILRVPGRISIIIPILLMLLLAWLFRINSPLLTFSGKKFQINPPAVLSIIAMLLIVIYTLLPHSIVSNAYEWSWVNMTKVPNWMLALNIILGILALTAVFINTTFTNSRYVGFMLCIITCVQVMVLIQYSVQINHEKGGTPSFQQMISEKKEKLDYQYLFGEAVCTNAVMKQAQLAYLEPFLGKFYKEYIITQSNDDAYLKMQQGRTPDQVVVEQLKPEDIISHNNQLKNTLKTYVKLMYSSYNRLIFEVSAPQDGFFGLSYPYSGHWEALVNTKEAPVYRANGASQAVRIPAGKNFVEFRYWSNAAFWGMTISCSMLIIIGFIFIKRSPMKTAGFLFTILCLILAISIFITWYVSLYAGKNLDTKYYWEPNSPETVQDLAYGKRTVRCPFISYDYLVQYPYLHAGGQAVDGDRSPNSGFITGLQNNPWWVVDLYHIENIGSILLYESLKGDTWNVRPLIAAFSDDGNTWRVLSFSQNESPIRLNFSPPITARYVMIRSSGYCRLSFDEVEIYPPE